jgi:hypothetical protein
VNLAEDVSTLLGDTQYESSQTIAELATAYEVGRCNPNIDRL